jgi:hypothetical protein
MDKPEYASTLFFFEVVAVSKRHAHGVSIFSLPLPNPQAGTKHAKI